RLRLFLLRGLAVGLLRAGLLRAGRALRPAVLRARAQRLPRAVIGRVEAGAFQDDADGVVDALELASASLAGLERRVGEPLTDLITAVALGAFVFVCGHGVSVATRNPRKRRS